MMAVLLAVGGMAFAPAPDGGSVEVLEIWSFITPAPAPERRKLSVDPPSTKCEKAWGTFIEMPCGESYPQLSAARLQCIIEQADSPIIRAAIARFGRVPQLTARMLGYALERVRPDVLQLVSEAQLVAHLSKEEFLTFCSYLPHVTVPPRRPPCGSDGTVSWEGGGLGCCSDPAPGTRMSDRSCFKELDTDGYVDGDGSWFFIKCNGQKGCCSCMLCDDPLSGVLSDDPDCYTQCPPGYSVARDCDDPVPS